MVVAGFQSYVDEKIPGSKYPANLRELIKEELTSAKQAPTVLLDASAFKFLFMDSEDAVFNYFQPSVIKKGLEEFVGNIISAGAHLIVVERGNYEKDANMWILKHKSDLDKLRNAGFSTKFEKEVENPNKIYTGKSMVSFPLPFSSIKMSNYQVFKSIDYVHKEVVKLATELNCLAVIGQDSNYLIYEGMRNYISTNSINLKTLDCTIYDRNKVIEHLQLESHDMPLFGTLCGNDIVWVQFLYHFHKKITKLNGNKFLQIAGKVKQWKGSSYDHIKDVVNEINHLRVNEKLIKESLDFYFNFESTAPKNKWLLFANDLKRTLKWENILYKIFILKEFRSETLTVKFLTFEFPIKFLSTLRRKIYGILFFEEENKTVAEYCLENQMWKKCMKPTYVDAIEPESKHPGLMPLFNEKTTNVEYMRWNLFFSSISKTINHSTIRKLPPQLVFPVLCLHCLVNESQAVSLKKFFIHHFEIEAFLIVAVLTCQNIDCVDLRNAQKLKKPYLRPINLSIIYLEVCFTLKMLNEACGLVFSQECSSEYNFYDELLFHSVYEKMKDGTKWEEFLGGEISLEVMFSTLLEIVLH